MDSKLHNSLAQLRIVTKFGMTGACLLMAAHCGLLLLGYDVFAVHVVFWLFVTLVALCVSRIFKMCWVHKLSIVYTMSVMFCVIFRQHGMFQEYGIDLTISRGIMFGIGIIMIILNVWKVRSKKGCWKNCLLCSK